MQDHTKETASTAMVVVAFAIVYLVWGSTYFFIQKALNGFPPLMLGAIRFIVAGLIMLLWSISTGEKIWDGRSIRLAALTGVMLLFMGNGAVIWVEQFMPSAMVAIVVSSSPIWFIVLDKPKWKQNFGSRATIAGLLIGFAGVLLLFGEKINMLMHASKQTAEIGGMLLLLVGAMSWAGGSLYSKYNTTTVSATVNSTWQMLAAGLAFVPFSLLNGETAKLHLQSIPMSAWLSLGYLIVFGSIAGFSAYVWLLKVRPATQVSTYAYVNPVVAVVLGVLFAHEHITAIQVCGLAIILVSVFLINLVKFRKEKAQQKLMADADVELTH